MLVGESIFFIQFDSTKAKHFLELLNFLLVFFTVNKLFYPKKEVRKNIEILLNLKIKFHMEIQRYLCTYCLSLLA